MILLAFLVLVCLAALLVALEPIHQYSDDGMERLPGRADSLDADTREALI